MMSSMLWAWRFSYALLTLLMLAFEPLGDHNGYIQIDLLRRHLDGLEDPHFEQELADEDRFKIHCT